ncbi:MAG: tetratricopeptide repeat protein [Treponema sp.]|jgi:tetratricopeptide (TPR) repeat protein|nr:tetratricopeptide repeat protein [Treponema sp.]
MIGDRPGGKEQRPNDVLRTERAVDKSSEPELNHPARRKVPASEGTLKEGIRLFRMKRWEKALEEFMRIKTEGFDAGDQAELAYFMGLCYTKLTRYDDALLYLEQVVVAGQNILRVYQCRMTLAYIYVITQRIKLAEFELKRLQRSGFESAQLYNTLAYAAWTRKHYKNAIDLYEKALDIDENNATAMNSMGFILADADIDIMRGLRLCRKAVDEKPQNPAYLDSLGWAYFKSGEPVEARTWLRRALDLAPNEQEIREHFKIVTGEAV